MVQNSLPGTSPLLAVALAFLAGLASHPANWWAAAAAGGGGPEGFGHDLEESTSTSTATTSAVAWVECPELNLTRDCEEAALPARPLRVAGGGVWATIELPLAVTVVGVIAFEIYLVVFVGHSCERRAVEKRKRQPLGEVRLQLAQ